MRLKRFAAIITAAICMTAVPGVQADAQDTTKMSGQNVDDVIVAQSDVQRYNDSTSTDEYDHVHDQEIINAILAAEDELDVTKWGIYMDNVDDIVLPLTMLHPEIYYLDTYGVSYRKEADNSYKIYLTFSYLESAGEIIQQRKEIDKAYEVIRKELDLDKLTDLEKVVACHDYLINTISYTKDVYSESYTDRNYCNIYSAFVNKEGLEYAYMEAFLYMMNQCGIRSGLGLSFDLSAGRITHGWNVVKLGDEWYHVNLAYDDVLGDLKAEDELGRVSHEYLLLGNSEYMKKTSLSPDDFSLYIDAGAKTASEFNWGSNSKYSGYFWNSSDAAACVKDGIWYYYDSSAKSIKSVDYPGTAQTIVSGIDAASCRLLLKDGMLLYSVKNEIRAYDIADRKTLTYYKPDISGSITSFGVIGGKLAYTYGTDNKLQYLPDNIDVNVNGLVNKDGTWRYYVNGVVDTSYKGLAYVNNRWWYVENGTINFKYTGMAYGNGRWWYFSNGAIDFKYTGMAYGNGRWWYFNNGAIDFKYTGTAYYKRWWYFSNGSINFTYTGMGYANNNWWMFQNGSINFKYTGIGQNNSGKWYFKNGQIAWKYSGNVTYGGKTYKVQNGKVVG